MSFLNSIPAWGWFDIGFNIAVLVALGGETDIFLKRWVPERISDLVSPESKRKRWKKFFEGLLIVGIAGEIFCLPFSIYGTAVAKKGASDAQEHANTLGLQIMDVSNTVAQANARTAEAEVIASSNALQVAVLALNNRILQQELISVSNSAAMNSPTNFPIFSAKGEALFFIDKSNAPPLSVLSRAGVTLELSTDKPGGSILIGTSVSWAVIDNRGNTDFGIDFDASNLETIGPDPKVTFANVHLARLAIGTGFPFVINNGTLHLDFNSEFDFSVLFRFLHQTNTQFGIFGVRQDW